MLSSLIGVKAQAELFDPAQPLKFGSIDQTNHHSTLRGVFTKRNDVMNRIAVNSLGQIRCLFTECRNHSITQYARARMRADRVTRFSCPATFQAGWKSEAV